MTPASATQPHQHQHQQAPTQPQASTQQIDEITRVFNTAIITSRAQAPRDFSGELYELMESPAFKTILASIRHHARTQGVSEAQAAGIIIETFRKVDALWSEFIFQEGVDRLKGKVTS